VALGQRPDYARIARHVINIDELFIDYARVFLPSHDRQAWDNVVRIAGGITEKNTPRNLQEGTATSSRWSSTFQPPD
jgi:hypothetical protein